jgi:preprotein translocase subunit SecG
MNFGGIAYARYSINDYLPGFMATVLLQSGRSAGLGAIAGGAQSLVGKKKGLDEKLGKVTTFLAVGFMLFTIALVVIN